MKGIGLVGAVTTLASAGYSFPRVAGTSAGAIAGALLAASVATGRDASVITDIMKTSTTPNSRRDAARPSGPAR